MDPEVYLKKHHIMTYIEDGMNQMMKRRAQDTKAVQLEFLLNYFQSVRAGSHIIFREYAYISATAHNRASFIKLVWQCYFSLSTEGVVMSTTEYFPLLQLLCSDFPPDIVQLIRALVHPSSNEVNINFTEFLYTFQVVFYFESFLVECYSVYRSLLMGIHYGQTNKPVVILPRSDTNEEELPITPTSPSLSQADTRAGNSISSPISPLVTFVTSPDTSSTISTITLTQSLVKLCRRLREKQPWLACPDPTIIEALLADYAADISFPSYLDKLTSSNDIRISIGVLPSKEEFINSPPPPLLLPATTATSPHS